MSKTHTHRMALLAARAAELGTPLAPAQLEMFQTYYETLIEWNQRVNLTAITDGESVQVKHFADSLATLLAPDLPQPQAEASLVDIGSGAGFPGLPLKIVRPAWRVVLVESTRKKTKFLEHLIHELDLADVDVVWGRAEEVGQNAGFRGQFDMATARAVADMAVLAEYALPLLRAGGRLIAQKGTNPAEEVEAAKSAIATLGGAHQATVPYQLPAFDDPLHLVIVEKIASTPAKYPRRPGMPEKRPIT